MRGSRARSRAARALGDPGNVARLAREQVSQHQQRIAEYEEMQARFGELPEVAQRMVTLRLGLEMKHAALRFWRSLAGGADEADAGQFFLATPPTRP